MVRVVTVEPMEGYRLRVLLSNGKQGIFDVTPYLDKGVFLELKDPVYFRRVKAAFGGVIWPKQYAQQTIEDKEPQLIILYPNETSDTKTLLNVIDNKTNLCNNIRDTYKLSVNVPIRNRKPRNISG